MSIEQEGVLLIVCGPSGVGKTSLCDTLLERFDQLAFSTSYTTRPAREDEVDGEDYHFVGDATFDAMVDEGEFAEYADVHGHRYGTTFEVIRRAWNEDRHLVFDIDYQGARQLTDHFPDSTGVLVIPPDMATLEDRLRGRDTEDSEELERRLENARMELSHYHIFDFVVENDDFDEAVESLEAIYRAVRHRRSLQAPAVERLLADD